MMSKLSSFLGGVLIFYIFVDMERNTVTTLSNWGYRCVSVKSDFAILDATHRTIKQMRELIRYACRACL